MRLLHGYIFALGSTIASPLAAATFAIEHTSLTEMRFSSGGAIDEASEFDAVSYRSGETPLNPDAVSANIGGLSFYEGRSAVRPNGALGIFQRLGSTGRLTTSVGIDFTIQTDPGETFDLSGLVIVDGGFIQTLDSADAEFMFDWDVAAGPLTASGSGATITPVRSYSASAEVAYDTLRRPVVTTSFNDSSAGTPGPVFDFEFIVDPSEQTVEIPFQVVPFDFGVMPENSIWRIEYTARLTSDVRGFTEGSELAFADPLMLDGQDPALQIKLVPAGPVDSDPIAAVPIPAGWALLFTALIGLGATRRSRVAD